MVISIILFLMIGLFEWFSCRKVLKINTEDAHIQTLVQKMENIRTRFSLVWITGVFALCVWMMWFIIEIGEKRTIPYLRSSFVMVAIILVMVIVLIICNIDRLAKMSDELLAQTSRLNGEDAPVPPTYHHSGAYWSGIILLVLCLVGLVFKLMYWPFGSLILMVASLAGLVFACLTGRHLVRIVPEERLVIRIAGVAGLFLVANAAFYLFDWPLGNIIGFISVLLLLISALVYWLRQRRRRA